MVCIAFNRKALIFTMLDSNQKDKYYDFTSN